MVRAYSLLNGGRMTSYIKDYKYKNSAIEVI